MPNPFPGMNPYLEDSFHWPDLHLRLLSDISDSLAPLVAPRYVVRAELRTYSVLVGGEERQRLPDVAIVSRALETSSLAGAAIATLAPPTTAVHTVTIPLLEEVSEAYLEIREPRGGQVITAIELLSPTNKMPGAGRSAYEQKRAEVFASLTNLVEIDLLRGGRPMPLEEEWQSPYRILVSPSWERRKATLYTFDLQSAIPEVAIPLRQEEAPVRLELGSLVNERYDRALYDLSIDYTEVPPEPPLSPEDAAWLDALLREKGLRPSPAASGVP